MTTHLAKYFQKKRLSLKLRLSDVAMRMGYKNAGRSLCHGCNRLHKFETTGEIDGRLFLKLMSALDIDQATVNECLQEDLEDWLRWANEPIRPYIVVRLMAAVYSRADLPDGIESVEDAERFASAFARERRMRICLVLSRRVSVWFDEQGDFQCATEAVPGGEPNEPYVRIGSRRCQSRFLGHGAALVGIEWFKRPQPREGG